MYHHGPIHWLNEEKGNTIAPNLTKKLFSATSEGGIRCIPWIQRGFGPDLREPTCEIWG